MKQFLLFVSLAGAALYALLVYSHHTITEGRSERVPARQTQPNDPSAQRLSSWKVTFGAARQIRSQPLTCLRNKMRPTS